MHRQPEQRPQETVQTVTFCAKDVSGCLKTGLILRRNITRYFVAQVDLITSAAKLPIVSIQLERLRSWLASSSG